MSGIMPQQGKLTNLSTQRVNANKHTPRGLGMLEKSIQQDGWIGAITVAADGETFDGSARLDVGVASGFEDAIVVESDGSKPVIVRRTDIATADDPRAKRLGIAANRVASVDLEWDTDVLSELQADGLLDGLFREDEVDRLLAQSQGVDDPLGEWAGMPEFEQEDLGAWKSIQVHFANEGDLQAFARLIGQTLTPQTRSVWYPPRTKNES